MENTSKVLARINSYIGNLENREKEQKLKRVTWTSSISAAIFLTVLVILYKPYGSPSEPGKESTSSPDILQEGKIDISKSILIDTLTVTAKPEWASLIQQEIEPLLSQATPPSHNLEEERKAPVPKQKKRSTKRTSSPKKSTRPDKVIAANDKPLTGVMRSSEPAVSSDKSERSIAFPMWEPDVEPQFPGGRAALSLFIQKNVTYPKIKKEARKEGTVYVRFTIDEWGEIKDSKVIKGLGNAYDQEALSLIQKMPKWIPGKFEGQAVSTYKDLGIMYKMY